MDRRDLNRRHSAPSEGRQRSSRYGIERSPELVKRLYDTQAGEYLNVTLSAHLPLPPRARPRISFIRRNAPVRIMFREADTLPAHLSAFLALARTKQWRAS